MSVDVAIPSGQRLHRRISMHEKPWYTPSVLAFVGKDIPRMSGLSPMLFARDLHTIEHRLSCEGESFLTKTLPELGKSIDLALQGHTPLITLAFRKISRGNALPAFLQALLKRVFLKTGWVADKPCPVCIRLLRQICYWCKKVEKGFTDESLQEAISDFIKVDAALPTSEDIPHAGTLGTAKGLIQSVFRDCPNLAFMRPGHGPGAVAGREGPEGKRLSRKCYSDLERHFRPIPFFFSLRTASENYELVTGRMQCAYGLSRTEFVEKDSSGPRTIGLEPAEYMWCQQAVKAWLYNHIESHRLTRGHVNFSDQTINRGLTSRWSEFDTLDMSKASDRNSLALVEALFGRTKLWPYLQACRTPGTLLPNGELLWFKKFAPMGSAVCFPVEAMVFWALAIASLHRQGYPLLLALRNVYVYGDDLVVPHGYFDGLKSDFESFGLKFNDSKCCTNGKFRESCGMDAYDGVDVTPIRLRKAYPKRDAPSLIPLIRHANSLFKRGYWDAAASMRTEALLNFPTLRKLKIPYSWREDLPILYWQTLSGLETVRYFHRASISRVEGWIFVPKTVRCTAPTEEHFLLESLSRGGPVGRIVNRPGGEGFRILDQRYVGRLKKRRLPVLPSHVCEWPI